MHLLNYSLRTVSVRVRRQVRANDSVAHRTSPRREVQKTFPAFSPGSRSNSLRAQSQLNLGTCGHPNLFPAIINRVSIDSAPRISGGQGRTHVPELKPRPSIRGWGTTGILPLRAAVKQKNLRSSGPRLPPKSNIVQPTSLCTGFCELDVAPISWTWF